MTLTIYYQIKLSCAPVNNIHPLTTLIDNMNTYIVIATVWKRYATIQKVTQQIHALNIVGAKKDFKALHKNMNIEFKFIFNVETCMLRL